MANAIYKQRGAEAGCDAYVEKGMVGPNCWMFCRKFWLGNLIDTQMLQKNKSPINRDLLLYSPIVTSAVIPQSKLLGCLSNATVTLKTTSPPTVFAMGEILMTFPLTFLFKASIRILTGAPIFTFVISRSLKSVVSRCKLFNVASVTTADPIEQIHRNQL